MQVAVRPDVVAIAAAVALVVGVAATVGALASARGSIAEQLGRSPQAGATVTSTISLRAALALLAGGGGLPGARAADRRRRRSSRPPRSTILLGLALATPGLVGLVAIALGRREHGGSKVALVARGAVEANPRRAALAAAIMALGVAAVVPPQLAEHALARPDRSAQPGRSAPAPRTLLASDDAFASVPIDTRLRAAGAARRVDRWRGRSPSPSSPTKAARSRCAAWCRARAAGSFGRARACPPAVPAAARAPRRRAGLPGDGRRPGHRARRPTSSCRPRAGRGSCASSAKSRTSPGPRGPST